MLISPEVSPLGLQMNAILLCPLMAFPLSSSISDVLSLSYEDTSHPELQPYSDDLI